MSMSHDLRVDDRRWSNVSPWDGEARYGDCELMLRRVTYRDDVDSGEPEHRVGFIRVDGALDHHTASLIRDACFGLLDACDEVRFDLSEITFIDSNGELLLEQCWERLDRRGRHYQLHNPSRVVRRLFRIMGVAGLANTMVESPTPMRRCRSAFTAS